MDEYGESRNGPKIVRQITATTASIILLQLHFFHEIGMVLEVSPGRGSVARAVVGKAGDSA
jgi:hypothetical protein